MHMPMMRMAVRKEDTGVDNSDDDNADNEHVDDDKR